MPKPNRRTTLRPYRAIYRSLVMVGMTCAALVLSSLPAVAAMPTLVTGLELEPGPKTVRVILSRKPQSLRTFVLKAPLRLVLDMTPARLGGGTWHLPTDHALIHGVRAGQFNAQTVRVVLDLKQEVTHVVDFFPAAKDGNGAAVVISLSNPLTSSLVSTKTPEPRTQAASSLAYATPPPEQTPDQTFPKPQPGVSKKIFVFGEPGQSSPSASEPESGLESSATQSSADKKILLFTDAPTQKADPEKASPWGELDLSGMLMGKVTQDLHESDNSGQERMLRNILKVEGKWTPPLLKANSTGSDVESTYLLASVQSDYLGFGPDPSSDDYDLGLYEAYLNHATPDWDLRLGRQIVRWGKADQISPVDNVNPQDLREFVIPDLEDRKVPNWMARLRLFPGDLTLEGVFIPVFQENTFDYSGNTWALLGVDDQGLKVDEDEPDQGLDSADWGLRTAASMAGWDVALSYLYSTQKSPHLRFDPLAPQGPTLHADYRRQHILGWEFETTVDKFGFRGEGAYFDEQSLVTQSMNSISRPMTHSVIGVDYLGEADWYINVQLSHQHIFDHEDDILFLRQDNFYLSGEINREFWRGNTMLKLGYAVDLRDGGSFFTPEAILTYFENLELSLGANFFFGPEASYFGRYRDNDQGFFKAVYHF